MSADTKYPYILLNFPVIFGYVRGYARRRAARVIPRNTLIKPSPIGRGLGEGIQNQTLIQEPGQSTGLIQSFPKNTLIKPSTFGRGWGERLLNRSLILTAKRQSRVKQSFPE